jgi:MazG family protein
MPHSPFDDLAQTMKSLRAPDGCPWDRAQTLVSLKPFLIEETYEVIDAIDGENEAEHLEELGDLLFQIVFQSQIRSEQGGFDFNDVAQTINNKMRRRHPHVFAQEAAETASDVSDNWDKLKQKERSKKEDKSRFAGIPKSAPGLLKAQRLGEKASHFGLDWSSSDGPVEKIREELAEFEQAHASKDQSKIEGEFGDLLFTLVNLARHLGIDAENAINHANRKFESRARIVETEVEREPAQTTATVHRAWLTAKRQYP